MNRLSEEQESFFETKGSLIIKNLLSSKEIGFSNRPYNYFLSNEIDVVK